MSLVILVPFLIAALLGALLGILLAVLWPRARARRILVALGEPTTKLDPHAPGETTVEGSLAFGRENEGEIVTLLPRGTEDSEEPVLGAKTTLSTAEPTLLLDKTRVRLEGPVQILLGASEGPRGTRRVQAGARVRARGHLKVEASDEAEGGYRDPSSRYYLVPPSDDEWKARPIPLAFAGAPRRSRVLPALVGALVASTAVLRVQAPKLAPIPAPVPIPAPHNPPKRPPCVDEIRALLDKGQLRDARGRAASCADPLTQAHTHWLHAQFEEASRAFIEARKRNPALEPTISEAEAHALAGHPAIAATTVRAMADAWYRGPETEERRRLLCIADSIAAHVDPIAKKRLEVRYPGERSYPDPPEIECALLRAELKERPNDRVIHPEPQNNHLMATLRRLIVAEAAERRDYFNDAFLFNGYPLPAMKDPRPFVHLRPLALEKRVAEQKQPSLFKAECAADLALFHAFMGDAESAKTMLDRIPKRGPGRTTYIMAAIAAVHANDFERARFFLKLGHDDSNAVDSIEHDIELLTTQGPADYMQVAREEIWSPNREIFRAARTGDGAAVAAELERLHTDARMPLLRVLPHLATGKGALVRWLENDYPMPDSAAGLFALAEGTGTRLALARATGDEALAAELAPIAKAASAAILDRTYALPFLLLENSTH